MVSTKVDYRDIPEEEREAAFTHLQKLYSKLEEDYSKVISDLSRNRSSLQETKNEMVIMASDIDELLRKLIKSEMFQSAADDEIHELHERIHHLLSLSDEENTTTGEVLTQKLNILISCTKEAISPKRQGVLTLQLQKELEQYKQQSKGDQEHYFLELSHKDDEILSLKKVINELQKQRKDIIDSSTDGVRGAKLENQQLKSDLQQAREERDILDLWNAENLRILTTQDEKLNKMKSAETLLKEQDARFKQESTRLLRSWNAQKLQHEQNLKNITKLEADCDLLKKTLREKDTLILELQKKQKSKALEQSQAKCERLAALLEESDTKMKMLNGKYKRLVAQHGMASLQKIGTMGMSIDTVATIIQVDHRADEENKIVNLKTKRQNSGLMNITDEKSKKATLPKQSETKKLANSNPYYVEVLKNKVADREKEIAQLGEKNRALVKGEREWQLKMKQQEDEKSTLKDQLHQQFKKNHELQTRRSSTSGIEAAFLAAVNANRGAGLMNPLNSTGLSSDGARSEEAGGQRVSLSKTPDATQNGLNPSGVLTKTARVAEGHSFPGSALPGDELLNQLGKTSGEAQGLCRSQPLSISPNKSRVSGKWKAAAVGAVEHRMSEPTPEDIMAQFNSVSSGGLDDDVDTHAGNNISTGASSMGGNKRSDNMNQRIPNPLENTAPAKPHWTTVLEKGRPRSAFTGRSLDKKLITAQSANAVPVGGLLKNRPTTAAGR